MTPTDRLALFAHSLATVDSAAALLDRAAVLGLGVAQVRRVSDDVAAAHPNEAVLTRRAIVADALDTLSWPTPIPATGRAVRVARTATSLVTDGADVAVLTDDDDVVVAAVGRWVELNVMFDAAAQVHAN